jgi:hypothetical protein
VVVFVYKHFWRTIFNTVGCALQLCVACWRHIDSRTFFWISCFFLSHKCYEMIISGLDELFLKFSSKFMQCSEALVAQMVQSLLVTVRQTMLHGPYLNSILTSTNFQAASDVRDSGMTPVLHNAMLEWKQQMSFLSVFLSGNRYETLYRCKLNIVG